jgi:dTDP-4-dehydrorhamnose 3,5-epimerase
MEVKRLRLEGLLLIAPNVFRDERGYFFESYRQPEFDRLGLPHFVQDNVSYSKKGTVRALHFQESPGQAKLVSCLMGKVFDVAVDMRPDSTTFGQWEGVVLEGETMFYIPVGFAHGYCALSEALFSYKVSAVYNGATERSIRWNDPDLGIEWPVKEPLLSLRDQTSPYWKEVVGAVLDHRR